MKLEDMVKEIPTHYVGISGKEYLISEYHNWGGGEFKHGKKDLPKEDYPYTIKYKIEKVWKCYDR